MRKLKVAINGFGRIGRVLERVNLKHKIFDLVAINDINADIKNLAYLLKYDSTYGRSSDTIEVISNNVIEINGQPVKVYNHKNIEDVPWYDSSLDVIVDSSGVSGNDKRIKKHENKFGHYVVTTEPGDHIKSVVCGVNEEKVDFSSDKYLSSSICDAAALAPIIKTIQESYIISHGFLTTLHPWLSFQNLMDGSKVGSTKDSDAFGLGRAALTSLIPKGTSAVSATDYITPGIKGSIESFSYRVPTATVSSAVLDLTLESEVTVEEIHNKLNTFEANQKYNALHVNSEHLVSIDYSGFDASCIVDSRWTTVNNGNSVRIVYWYDNEWGYCSRLADLVHYLGVQKFSMSNEKQAKEQEEPVS